MIRLPKKLFREPSKRGCLIVISAPSGAGKTTVVERWLKKRPELERSISYTTRKPRVGEKNGREYYFITKCEFLRRRKQGLFLEWARVFGRYYGTSKDFCLRQIKSGRNVVLTIDVQGKGKIEQSARNRIPMTSIFIAPPSGAVLKERLLKRKTDSPEEIKKRLRIAKREMIISKRYDHTVVNRKVNETVRRIDKIVFGIKKFN